MIQNISTKIQIPIRKALFLHYKTYKSHGNFYHQKPGLISQGIFEIEKIFWRIFSSTIFN
ncbi:hypothetical protein DRF60_14025 [Chryseobacterium elymi]|uniref:Uncharacterized protein n=1 Tax=Chryseobacterium elymi TaxID=395936 RepID=A0A3D9DET5_9FLAO|nr:hypothetical protein DRF60_14025 [Chryseobacterium elymi]